MIDGDKLMDMTAHILMRLELTDECGPFVPYLQIELAETIRASMQELGIVCTS